MSNYRPMKKSNPRSESKISPSSISFMDKIKESGYRCKQVSKDGYTIIYLMPLESLLRGNGIG